MQHIIQDWKDQSRGDFEKEFGYLELDRDSKGILVEIYDYFLSQLPSLLTLLEEGVGKENLRFPHSEMTKNTTYGNMGDAFVRGTNEERRRIRNILSEAKKQLG